ncbi:MAG: hypothetical protein HRT89_06190 [Lentisphaeria bacterium]|nr:hypothetical protein [Lentisphaeria bacterium]NQZ67642.1 hypothetical protein [Lentisphaeria bacterium]
MASFINHVCLCYKSLSFIRQRVKYIAGLKLAIHYSIALFPILINFILLNVSILFLLIYPISAFASGYLFLKLIPFLWLKSERKNDDKFFLGRLFYCLENFKGKKTSHYFRMGNIVIFTIVLSLILFFIISIFLMIAGFIFIALFAPIVQLSMWLAIPVLVLGIGIPGIFNIMFFLYFLIFFFETTVENNYIFNPPKLT